MITADFTYKQTIFLSTFLYIKEGRYLLITLQQLIKMKQSYSNNNINNSVRVISEMFNGFLYVICSLTYIESWLIGLNWNFIQVSYNNWADMSKFWIKIKVFIKFMLFLKVNDLLWCRKKCMYSYAASLIENTFI